MFHCIRVFLTQGYPKEGVLLASNNVIHEELIWTGEIAAFLIPYFAIL